VRFDLATHDGAVNGRHLTEGKARLARNGYNGGQRELLREISKMLRKQKEILGCV